MSIKIEYLDADGNCKEVKVFDAPVHYAMARIHPIVDGCVKARVLMEVPICCGMTDFIEIYST